MPPIQRKGSKTVAESAVIGENRKNDDVVREGAVHGGVHWIRMIAISLIVRLPSRLRERLGVRA